MLVTADAELAVSPEACAYVSRGGLKLDAALDAFGFDPSGTVALDIGASTGGFTDVLIARGAAKIYAVDVGSGQLHAKLTVNPKIIAMEGTDARALDRPVIREEVTAIVADVSFISLTLGAARRARALPRRAPGWWLWSSRNSRPAARRSAKAASCAKRSRSAESCGKGAGVHRGRRAGRWSARSPRRSWAAAATQEFLIGARLAP